MTWHSPWLDFVPGHDSPETVDKGTVKTDRTGFVSSVSPVVGRFGISDAPRNRPLEQSTADWLATLPEEQRRDWWRSVARNYCHTRDWYTAEQSATEQMQRRTSGDSTA